jgi:hypothetical protein
MPESESAAFLKEILERAIDAISEGRRDHIYRWEARRRVILHYERDRDRLDACCAGDVITEEDYWGVILDCLELALEDPVGTYKRPQSPFSSHKEAPEEEMYAFVVQLDDFTCPIYTKFCLIEKSDGTWYVSIRCHT